MNPPKRDPIMLDGDAFARGTVERALGSILLERIERLEPIARIHPSSVLLYNFDLDGKVFEVRLKVVSR